MSAVGDMSGAVKVRPELEAVAEELAEKFERWEAAHLAWQEARDLQSLEVGRARRRVVAATGGLGPHRWKQACAKQRFRTVADAKSKASALRARPAVEAALAMLRDTATEHDTAVEVARLKLAVASQRMLSLGPLGIRATGLSVYELRRLARSDSKTGV